MNSLRWLVECLHQFAFPTTTNVPFPFIFISFAASCVIDVNHSFGVRWISKVFSFEFAWLLKVINTFGVVLSHFFISSVVNSLSIFPSPIFKLGQLFPWICYWILCVTWIGITHQVHRQQRFYVSSLLDCLFC